MIMQICPKCKFTNKGTATDCTHCGYSFVSKSDSVFLESQCCYYHPDRVAVTTCVSCKKRICTEDSQKKTEWFSNTLCLFNLLLCNPCGSALWHSDKDYCPECYGGKFPKHQESIMQPKICPKCQFTNKGISTDCTHCGYSFDTKSNLIIKDI